MQDYDRFTRGAERARQMIGIERAACVEKAYHSIENGMTLLGATGIEDSLQEDVEETLESLRAAGIKVSAAIMWIIFFFNLIYQNKLQ